ncbi:glycosyltransferase [Patescibacteria group bacterium]|nr:glycosyltransferase [Patescibacteria group bacterium]
MATRITTHTIVKNEQNWIKPALMSVIDQVNRMLVWDTGSTDNTVSIIKSINSPKIVFSQKGPVDRQQLVNLRNLQIKATQTPWFIILDGDEIWPKDNLIQLIKAIEKAKPSTIALVNRTKNCIGDLHHFLPETKGRYQIGPWKGHLNIRAIKNLPGLKVVGEYPDEAYVYQSKKLQDQPKNLEFVDTWYLHTTHLKRTGWWHSLKVIDRLKKFKLFTT